MNSPRIVILGPITAAPNAIELPTKQHLAKNLLKIYNFTRVATEENELVDHISFLKRQRGISENNEFSVWEMFGCAGLLLTSHLRRNGFTVKLVNYMDSDNVDREIAEVQSFRPDIVALSTTFVLSRNHLVDIGKKLRAGLPEAFLFVFVYVPHKPAR